MKLIRRHPDKAYVDNWMWVPKRHVNLEGTKKSLSFLIPEQGGGVRELKLWRETADHLLVPRALWRADALPFEIVDCRPQHYSEVDFHTSIKLDHLPGPNNNLVPTGLDVQQRAMDTMLQSTGGILQLACVSGDTELCLNRGGKGFKMQIGTAFRRMHHISAYKWDRSIPTYIRSKTGDRIGLNRVEAIIERGERTTYTLELEDSKKLRLTREHQVLTSNGFKSIEEGLAIGDEVIVDGERTESVRKSKKAYKRIGGFRHHPYARFQSRSYVIEEHRAVAEATMNGLSLQAFKERCRTGAIEGLQFIDPDLFHVHHKDENKSNNDPKNLEVLPVEDHLQQHRPGADAFGYGVPTPVRVKSISKGKLEPVYDVVCEDPYRNFVANGIIIHNCGKGKTVIFLALAAAMRVPTLIIIDNTTLMKQWAHEIDRFMKVPGGVGLIQADTFDWKHGLVLTTYHTIAARADEMSEEIRRWFGLIGWDEGHHISAPTFAKSADLFYGLRIALTATPTRVDGTHVIYEFHVGPVIFKDLSQTIKPRIYFKWTDIQVDATNPLANIRDRNHEIHLSKLYGHLGSLPTRINIFHRDIDEALRNGRRKILVLSNSVASIMNLATQMVRGPGAPLYSDIPVPTALELGETLEPLDLAARDKKKYEREVKNLELQLTLADLNPIKRNNYRNKLLELQDKLAKGRVFDKIQAVVRKRQLAFIRALEPLLGEVGVMIGDIEAERRLGYARNSRIVLAIMKYGKEGLDAPSIDTIFVLDPFSQRNGLQQLMGRCTRPAENKMEPIVVFYEDNVGHIIAMCKKLRQHLSEWSHEEGGPFPYNLIGHPRNKQWKNQNIFTATGS